MSRDFIAPMAAEAPEKYRLPRATRTPVRDYCGEPGCPVWVPRTEAFCRKHAGDFTEDPTL